MTEKVGPDKAELVLGDVPGQLRKRRREPERLYRHSFLLLYTPELKPARREVVRVTSSPRSLRPRPTPDLARQLRAHPLPIADSPVGTKPPPADPTRALLEHPTMLGRLPGNVDGPLLASSGGSFLASA